MRISASLAAAMLLSHSAAAHVGFDRNEAQAGETVRIAIEVTSGCRGSPTTSLRLHIPEGVGSVKPMPKPGWTLAMRGGEIAWSGGNLPDAWNDEFIVFASLPATPGRTLLFPVLQTCERGEIGWSQDPTRSSVRAIFPAPYILLTRP